MALVEAHKAAVAAKAEIEAPKVAEDLTYAYKYFAGSQEVEGKIAKGGLMSDAIEALTGEGKTIDQLNAEIASYTEEYKAFLKALAADEDLEEDKLPSQIYMSGSRAGQAFGVKAASVASIEYSVAPGLVLGFEFQPLAYRYDVIQICPKGFDNYNASHHNIKIFDMPVLKLGIRF